MSHLAPAMNLHGSDYAGCNASLSCPIRHGSGGHITLPTRVAGLSAQNPPLYVTQIWTRGDFLGDYCFDFEGILASLSLMERGARISILNSGINSIEVSKGQSVAVAQFDFSPRRMSYSEPG